MQKYIAILRCINVGGKNKIRMKDLTVLLEKAGLRNVQTYIQSGNIVFDHDEKPEKYFEESAVSAFSFLLSCGAFMII